MSFDPKQIQCFRFVSYDFDPETATASLRYAFDDGPLLVETYTFEGCDLPLSAESEAALEACLRYLHLVAGISYYKAAVPPEIKVETGALPSDSAAFLETLYLHGLGEFAHENELNLHGRIKFPFDPEATHSPSKLALPRRTAVPVGGGKDSIVSIEALKHADEPIVLFSVGDHRPIREVSEVAGVERIIVKRRLDPQLFAYNKAGAYNGHVPISAIIACVLATSAVLYGFDRAALSNERSASVGNFTRDDGFEVNHQYSKGLPFERDFTTFYHDAVLPAFRYFSFLRPLSELGIVQRFARCEDYHGVFTSCNRAFRILAEEEPKRWCLDCPKCRFVFLCLAPFLPKSKLLAIFGHNMLDDPSQQAGFDALIGYNSHKPFECVGEVEESTAAFVLLSRDPAWQNAYLVRRFVTEILPQVEAPEKLIEEAFTPTDAHLLPDGYREKLENFGPVKEVFYASR